MAATLQELLGENAGRIEAGIRQSVVQGRYAPQEADALLNALREGVEVLSARTDWPQQRDSLAGAHSRNALSDDLAAILSSQQESTHKALARRIEQAESVLHVRTHGYSGVIPQDAEGVKRLKDTVDGIQVTQNHIRSFRDIAGMGELSDRAAVQALDVFEAAKTPEALAEAAKTIDDIRDQMSALRWQRNVDEVMKRAEVFGYHGQPPASQNELNGLRQAITVIENRVNELGDFSRHAVAARDVIREGLGAATSPAEVTHVAGVLENVDFTTISHQEFGRQLSDGIAEKLGRASATHIGDGAKAVAKAAAKLGVGALKSSVLLAAAGSALGAGLSQAEASELTERFDALVKEGKIPDNEQLRSRYVGLMQEYVAAGGNPSILAGTGHEASVDHRVQTLLAEHKVSPDVARQLAPSTLLSLAGVHTSPEYAGQVVGNQHASMTMERYMSSLPANVAPNSPLAEMVALKHAVVAGQHAMQQAGSNPTGGVASARGTLEQAEQAFAERYQALLASGELPMTPEMQAYLAAQAVRDGNAATPPGAAEAQRVASEQVTQAARG